MTLPLTRRAAFALTLLAAFPVFAEPKKPADNNDPLPPEKAPPEVDQARVDAAVAKGSEWLRALLKKGLPPINEANDGNHSGQTYNEIVLYTLVHAGVNKGDPDLIKLVQAIQSKPPVHTYTGAMRAMAFELYDPVVLRRDIANTAQFLVDNQGKIGMWGYSRPVNLPELPKVTFSPSPEPPKYTLSGPGADGRPTVSADPTPPGAADVAPAPAAPPPAPVADAGRSGKTVTKGIQPGMTTVKKVPPKSTLPRRDWGSPNDNSNTQYAMLGLRAAMACAIFPPPDCFPATEKWFTDAQNDDGGWGYKGKGDKSYGSMTVGGVSSLAVCLRGSPKPRDPRRDPRVQKAVKWLGDNLKFDENPHKGDWHYYWIYGVERAGALAETEWFGDRPWYHDGADYLLSNQHGDGTWGRTKNDGEKILDTCWAILFLRRATKHIVQKKIEYTQ